jgi:hypothetical protein
VVSSGKYNCFGEEMGREVHAFSLRTFMKSMLPQMLVRSKKNINQKAAQPSASISYELDLCFGSNLNPGAAGPRNISLQCSQYMIV